ncbi:MAG: ATP-binding protein [Anaerolineales bacterium]
MSPVKYGSTRWRIAIPYVLLIVAAMAGLALYLSNITRDTYLENLEAQLTGDVRLIADALAPQLADLLPGDDFDTVARHYGDLLGVRVTVIGLEGAVLGESQYNRLEMDNHLYRPEVQEALSTGWGRSTRYSRTARQEMMYVALATEEVEGLTGIVRVALPLEEIQANLSLLNRAVATATLITGLLAVGLALFIADRTTRPARQLTQVVRQMAAGDLSARLLPRTRDEIGQLTQTFNHMAEQLQEQIRALSTERGRLAAILEHMADGVLIVDEGGRVEMMNLAAARILDTAPAQALERSFAEVARHHRLIELWRRCQRSREEHTEVIETRRGEPQFLQIIVTPLRDTKAPGYLIILQDLTRIRRLETVRRDFISNISHELRTPLASLNALVETLQDGAITDPPAATRFLTHMAREVSAMTQIVEELLELSRIESGKVPLHVKPTPVSALITPPVERLTPQAERAGLVLSVELPLEIPQVLADAERVQRVVTNLVHNAIKFTPTGGSVTIHAERQGNKIVIAVEDTGVGIVEQDLPRIFERFYKADRARSGGGTGLGLAIAKHIIQAHGGHIWVESEENHGSTFAFSLPIVENLHLGRGRR